MSRSKNWMLNLLGVLAKVLVIMTTADLLGYLFRAHYDIAYVAGLLVGAVVQHAIPPKARWEKEALLLLPILLFVGIIYASFHR